LPATGSTADCGTFLSFPILKGNLCVLSPSDTSYGVLNTSPSMQELDKAFTPDLFELIFARQRTRQPASLVGLLLSRGTENIDLGR
jgi:hypothetical protein